MEATEKISIEQHCYVFTINSESIHKIMTDDTVSEDCTKIAVVLNVNYDFIKQIIPEMDQKYFAAVTDFDVVFYTKGLKG